MGENDLNYSVICITWDRIYESAFSNDIYTCSLLFIDCFQHGGDN